MPVRNSWIDLLLARAKGKNGPATALDGVRETPGLNGYLAGGRPCLQYHHYTRERRPEQNGPPFDGEVSRDRSLKFQHGLILLIYLLLHKGPGRRYLSWPSRRRMATWPAF
jgi:hypothetical protein